MGSQAHLNLLMDAAEQVGGALVHMHSKNVAHLDIKVAAPSAAQLDACNDTPACHTPAVRVVFRWTSPLGTAWLCIAIMLAR